MAAALIDIDVLLARSLSKDPMAVFVGLEKRLYKTAVSVFLRRAERGVEEAVNFVRFRAHEKPTQADVRRVEQILRRTFRGVGQEIRPVLTEVMRRSYVEGQRMTAARIVGHISGLKKADAGDGLTGAAALAPLHIGIAPSFEVEDRAAIRAFIKHQLFWIGENYDQNLSRRIAEVCEEVMVRRGYDQSVAADELQKALVAEFDIDPEAPFLRGGEISIPAGYTGTVMDYFRGLASNATTVARVSGSVREFQRAKVSHYEWVNPNDDRTCDVCSWMDGKIFSVDQTGVQIDAMVNAKTPNEVKSIHPWAHLSQVLARTGMTKAMSGRVSPERSLSLQAEGYGMPPIHYACRCTVDIAEDATIGDLDYGSAWAEEESYAEVG